MEMNPSALAKQVSWGSGLLAEAHLRDCDSNVFLTLSSAPRVRMVGLLQKMAVVFRGLQRLGRLRRPRREAQTSCPGLS